MGCVNFSDFRANMAKHLDKVEDDRDELIVTRQGREPFVVMTLRDLEGLKETLYLLSNPANARRLKESIAQAEEGNVIEVDPKTFLPKA
jgi:antitoxin YefM